MTKKSPNTKMDKACWTTVRNYVSYPSSIGALLPAEHLPKHTVATNNKNTISELNNNYYEVTTSNFAPPRRTHHYSSAGEAEGIITHSINRIWRIFIFDLEDFLLFACVLSSITMLYQKNLPI